MVRSILLWGVWWGCQKGGNLPICNISWKITKFDDILDRELVQKSNSDGIQGINLKHMTSLDFLVHVSCHHDCWNDAKITKISSNFVIFQEMLQMGRFPPFGQPHHTPQRRVLRTMYLRVCKHQSIVRQHSEIAFLDVIWRTETSS